MKKYILFLLLLSICVLSATAQTLTYEDVISNNVSYKNNYYKEYVASNGETFRVGDRIEFDVPNIIKYEDLGNPKHEYESIFLLFYGAEIKFRYTDNQLEAIEERTEKQLSKMDEEKIQQTVEKGEKILDNVMTIDKICIKKKGGKAGEVYLCLRWLLSGYHVYVEKGLETGEFHLVR